MKIEQISEHHFDMEREGVQATLCFDPEYGQVRISNGIAYEICPAIGYGRIVEVIHHFLDFARYSARALERIKKQRNLSENEWVGFSLDEWCRKRFAPIIGAALSPHWKKWIDEHPSIYIDLQRRLYSMNGPRLVYFGDLACLDDRDIQDIMNHRYAAHAFLQGGVGWRSDLEYLMRDKTMRKSLSQMPGIPTSLYQSVLYTAESGYFPPRVLRTPMDWVVFGTTRNTHTAFMRAFERSNDKQMDTAYRIMARSLELGRKSIKNMVHATVVMTDIPVKQWPYNGTMVAVAEAAVQYHHDVERDRLERDRERMEIYEKLSFEAPPFGVPNGFEYIDNGLRLLEEGRDMKHCVADYAWGCREGHSFIFSYQDKWGRATLEVNEHGRLVQSQGPRNHRTKTAVKAERLMRCYLKSVPKPEPVIPARNRYNLEGAHSHVALAIDRAEQIDVNYDDMPF